MSALEKQPGAIDIASSSQAAPKPLLPVNPMSAPHAGNAKVDANVSAPDIGRTRRGRAETLIALSATPAPVAPPPAILSPWKFIGARFDIAGRAEVRCAWRDCFRHWRGRHCSQAWPGRHLHQRRERGEDQSDFRAGHRLRSRRKRQCTALAAASAPAHHARRFEIANGGCGRSRYRPRRNWGFLRRKCSARNAFIRCT